jgi:hypothetical protein
MFCIAAFIILLLVGIVSAKYRRYVGKAWRCVWRKVTFRPCDTSFKEEFKGRLLARVAIKKPRLVKPAGIGLEIVSWLIVILTVWSLFVAVKSGVNLYVYSTCNPSNAASCSLGGETCSIETNQLNFIDSVKQFKIHAWFINEFREFNEAVAAIPTRIQNWQPEEYLPANVTYLNKYDTSKPTALEIIDPGCNVCQKLFNNIKTTGFDERYNLAYIAYPISSDGSYRFTNSLLITQYLEAIRLHAVKQNGMPVDWKILVRIFTESDETGYQYQSKFNSGLNHNEAVALLDKWLEEFGYNSDQIASIKQTSMSDQVTEIISNNKNLVENRIKTVKIPTIIFDGRRHDDLVSVDRLD